MTPKDLKILFEQGKHREIIEKLMQLETKGLIAFSKEDEQFEYLYYKSRSLERLGRYEEALQVATEARKTFASPTNRSLTLALVSAQYYALSKAGRWDEALKVSTEGDTIMESLTAKERKSGSTWIALFYYIRGATHLMSGDLDWALDYLQRSLTLREELDNSFDIASSLYVIGDVYSAKGELTKSLLYYKRSLQSFEDIGNPNATAYTLIRIGGLYFIKSELKTALDYYQRSLELFEKIADRRAIVLTLNEIGGIHWYKGELATALNYLQRSLEISEAISIDYVTSLTLFYLILVTLDQQDQDHIQAQVYLKELQQLQKHSSNKWIDLENRLAEALVLKRSPRMKDKVRAQTILEQLVDEKPNMFRTFLWHTLAMIHLCDLLLLEAKSFGETDVWEEAKGLIQRLYAQAQDQQAFGLLVEALLLQARFAVIDGNLDLAQNHLDQARITSEEKELGLLGQKVTAEQQRFQAEFEKWRTLIQGNASLQERLDYAQLQKYLQSVQKIVKLWDLKQTE
ncbi:MAG: tetratricopeptide repeat protein [Candidatus Hermodarchaeota archaeon]